jgi:hypothetical protein
MERTIKIPQIVGEFTNGDLEDISPEYATLLSNLRPNNGKVEKTFGFGTLLNSAVGFTPKWIGTYFHQSLNSTNGSGTGYVYLAYTPNLAMFPVSIYEWNGGAWVSIDGPLLTNALGNFYHKNDTNPVIQENGIIRFLPGNVGKADGSHASEGIWIGYIDQNFFDGGWNADDDYTAGFYAYPTTINTPLVTSGGLGLALAYHVKNGGSFSPSTAPQTRVFYKYAYVYDGVQTSKLSDAFACDIKEDDIVIQEITMAAATHPLRITGLKIYRCDTVDGAYLLIHEISLTRNATNYSATTDGAYCGRNAIYIPALSTVVWGNPIVPGTYIIRLTNSDGTIKDMTIPQPTPGTTGRDTFYSSSDTGLYDFWDCQWAVKRSIDGGFSWIDPPATGTISGINGAYAGQDVIVFNDPLSVDFNQYVGGVIVLTDPSVAHTKQILAHYVKAMRVAGVFDAVFSDQPFAFIKLSDGLYYYSTDKYYFFDYKLTAGEAHPYPNAVSLNINGRFAQANHGRLFLQDIVLDPGDTDEAHDDWIGYSESGSYDVLNVSNVFHPSDSKGGAGIGLKLSFNSLIAMKPHSYFKIDLVDPADATTWITKESRIERGNIAPFGCIQIGHKFYPLSYDGIYEVDVNMLAASNDTPLVDSRASEDINDQYLLISDANKALIIAGYDQINNELIYKIGTFTYLAFNTVKKKWRTLVTTTGITCFGYDNNGNLMGHNAVNGKICSLSVRENVSLNLKTKHFRVSFDRPDIVDSVKITYSSINALSVNMYRDGLFGTAIALESLTATTAGEIKTVQVATVTNGTCIRCKLFMIEIVDVSANDDDAIIYSVEPVYRNT